MMRCRVWLVGLLAALLLVSGVPVAAAQDGDGGKVVVGQSYVLATGHRLDGDLAVFGGSVTLERDSVVNGSLLVMGGMLTASGEVRGDVAVFGGGVSLRDTAVIEGDLAAIGGSLQRAPGAVVGGEVVQGFVIPDSARSLALSLSEILESRGLPRPDVSRGGPSHVLPQLFLWPLQTLGWGLLLALLGIVLVGLAPQPLEEVVDAAAREPLLSFGMGLLTLIVAALTGLLLLIACGLGLLVWLAALLTWLVGWTAVGLGSGRRVLSALKVSRTSAWLEVALGVFLITLLARIPWGIGLLFIGILGSAGVGAVLLTRFGTQPVGRLIHLHAAKRE